MPCAAALALPQDPFQFVHIELQRYAGKCLGREGSSLIVQRLTASILARGYTTTRVGVPEQDLSQGVLTLTLVPGDDRGESDIVIAVKRANGQP
jgi:hemolysin activation/secretion protein